MSIQSQLQLLALSIFLTITPTTRAQDVQPLSGHELAEFLGPVSPNVVRWTKQSLIDFELYNGEAVPPLSGRIAFYRGAHPNPEHPADSTIVRARLGIYPTKWYRWTEDGWTRQQALIRMRWYQQIDIRISAPRQTDFDQLISIASQLPLFNKTPERFPPGESIFDEVIDTHLSLYYGILLLGPVFFLIGFWLLQRRLRQPYPKLSRRLMLMTVYSIVLFICFVALWILSIRMGLATMPIVKEAARFSLLYGVLLTAVFSVILPILALVQRCFGR